MPVRSPRENFYHDFYERSIMASYPSFMTSSTSEVTPLTARIGRTIKAERNRRGLSAPELAARCAGYGVSVPANAINKIETGRRESLKLEEAIAFAYVLEMPLVSLLVPLDESPDVELLPGLTLPTWEAAAWVTGEDRDADDDGPGAALASYREHEVDVRTALISTHEAHTRRVHAGRDLGSPRYEQLTRQAAEFERLAHEDCQRLRETRRRMRSQGLHPAPLPSQLAFIDHDHPFAAP
ncbi:helix-turn-helix domain-containing protein [Streptacidiphilus sp. MAP5-52]|uniref:helix-turn-helix domain-containing protein n=1 Tax=Streptacidiphilus sp. MAP5-52 TaxID=3156267 RepID=UPI003510FBE6